MLNFRKVGPSKVSLVKTLLTLIGKSEIKMVILAQRNISEGWI